MFPLVGGADKLEKVKIFMKRERYKRVYAHFRASRIGCLHSLFFFQVTFNHATHKKSKLTNLGTAKECTNISSHSRIFFYYFCLVPRRWLQLPHHSKRIQMLSLSQ